MKIPMHQLTAATLTALLLIAQPTSAQMVLFDGSNLDDFNQLGDANWTISGDVVEATSGGGHLVTRNSYADFVLTAEFWVDDPANSGIFIRCQDPQMISPNSCYEINIFDQREDQTYRTGVSSTSPRPPHRSTPAVSGTATRSERRVTASWSR